MILVKKWKFFHLLCLSKTDLEKLFGDVLDKRTSIYEKRKIRIFPNGLVHGFGQKFKIFSTLIFMQNRTRKSIWERSS